MEKVEKKFYELTASEGMMLYDGETYAEKVSTTNPDKWQKVERAQYEAYEAEQQRLAEEAMDNAMNVEEGYAD